MREDWIEVELGDVGKVVSGGTPKTDNPEYWGDEISWITPADLSGYTEKYISKGRKSITKVGLEKSSARLIPANSVLFSSRAPIGYTVIAKNELCTNQGFKSLIPYECLDSNYLFYYLKSSKQRAEDNANGTTFKEISGKSFSELPIPLAPLPEQRAIAAKIEQLFSELDNGIANLKAAKSKLEIYRQAILKQAFEGTNNQDIQFRNGTIGEFSSIIAGNAFKKSEYSSSGIRLFQIANVSFNRIIWDSVVYLPSDYLRLIWV